MSNVTKTARLVGNLTYITTIKTWTQRSIGKCKKCRKGYVATHEMCSRREERLDTIGLISFHATNTTPYPSIECCGRHVLMQDIKGTKSDHKCDAKCLNSKGHICECSCGGKNHGKNWE